MKGYFPDCQDTLLVPTELLRQTSVWYCGLQKTVKMHCYKQKLLKLCVNHAECTFDLSSMITSYSNFI